MARVRDDFSVSWIYMIIMYHGINTKLSFIRAAIRLSDTFRRKTIVSNNHTRTYTYTHTHSHWQTPGYITHRHARTHARTHTHTRTHARARAHTHTNTHTAQISLVAISTCVVTTSWADGHGADASEADRVPASKTLEYNLRSDRQTNDAINNNNGNSERSFSTGLKAHHCTIIVWIIIINFKKERRRRGKTKFFNAVMGRLHKN